MSPSGMVTVDFQLDVVRPTASLQVSDVTAGPPTQGLETRVQGSIIVTGGTATVTGVCSVQFAGQTPVVIDGVGFSQTIAEGAAFAFDQVVAVDLPFPASSDGTLSCTIDGSTSSGQDVNISRQAAFTAADFRPAVSDCSPDAETMCLLGDRFKVTVDWRSDNSQGVGRVPEDERFFDGGGFYFFSPDNVELFVQMTNGCSNNNHFWVFNAGLTNVEYTLTVSDTQTGLSRAYSNPLGQPAGSVTDTQAFATCP